MEKFKKIKEFPNYKISNLGRIINIKTKKELSGSMNVSGRNYVYLSKEGKRYPGVMRAKLVLLHFKKKELDKNYVLHLDSELSNHSANNLDWATFGDVKRMFNTIKNKKRGVYAWNQGKKRFRAVLKVNDRVQTIGYYETRDEAERAFIEAYTAQYGYAPYV